MIMELQIAMDTHTHFNHIKMFYKKKLSYFRFESTAESGLHLEKRFS